MAFAVSLRAAVALTGQFPALAGIDLTVETGETVVLEGANGAGKTSLLRACAGLLPVTGGEAVVLGHDLRRDRAGVRRQVGMLGHAAALYDELSVAENVRFAVRAAGAATDGIDAALDRFGLVGRLRKTPVGRLSAGQRRRVALAVLVARRPALWLLDEPHAALDAAARALLDEVVGEVVAGGATVLLASHEPGASLPLADRLVSLAGGRVVGQRSLRRPVATGPVATGPVATGPVATGPVATGPVATGPVVTGPVATGPVATGPVVTGPVVTGGPVAGGRRIGDSHVA